VFADSSVILLRVVEVFLASSVLQFCCNLVYCLIRLNRVLSLNFFFVENADVN